MFPFDDVINVVSYRPIYPYIYQGYFACSGATRRMEWPSSSGRYIFQTRESKSNTSILHQDNTYFYLGISYVKWNSIFHSIFFNCITKSPLLTTLITLPFRRTPGMPERVASYFPYIMTAFILYFHIWYRCTLSFRHFLCFATKACGRNVSKHKVKNVLFFLDAWLGEMSFVDLFEWITSIQ